MNINSPDLLFQTTFTNQLTELRQRLDASALEIVTGRRADTTKAARGDNNTLLRAQATLDASEPERGRLAILEGRYRVAANGLRTISELSQLTSLSAIAAGDIGGAQADEASASEARSSLQSIFGTLDTRFGGRALFSGDAGTSDPLASIDDFISYAEGLLLGAPDAATKRAALETEFDVGGSFETTIYTGGVATGDPELLGGGSLDALPTANDAPVRDLLRGLTMIAFNDQIDEAERPEWLQEAAIIVQSASEQLIGEEASIGLSLAAIEREIERQDELKFEAELTLETILGRDEFEAAAETQALEARLQAAYTITSRISNLRLTNFLR